MRRSLAEELDLSHVGSPPRFGELSKLLPVTAVVVTIAFLYVEYVFLHCLRLLQLDMPSSHRRAEDVSRAVVQMAVFHTTTALLLYCLGRCVLMHPGGIPDSHSWDIHSEADERGKDGGPAAGRSSVFVEKKGGGQLRHCKWCLRYKPDRCHHCRICNMCVLRMDHHCPWVYNCIGFKNHKYFMLLLLYGGMDLCFITATMFDTVWWSTRTDVNISTMMAMVFGYAFAVFLLVLMITFFTFHLWLMARAMTTVEFCEKKLKVENYDSSIYDWGIYANVCAVLGPRPFLWLLPVSPPVGDGLYWNRPGSGVPSSGSASRPSAAGGRHG